jgi:amino-acid N-acetyltransferase
MLHAQPGPLRADRLCRKHHSHQIRRISFVPCSPKVEVQQAEVVPTSPGTLLSAQTATSNGSVAGTIQGSGEGLSCSILNNAGALCEDDFGKFVQFFRQASPYIAGHRARTFVVVIPGEVVMQQELLQTLVSDIALLHGLGIRLVVVLGAAPQIDAALEELGSSSVFVGGYRVTDAAALEAAVQAAGRSRTAVEQFLSRGPSVPVFRRHAKGETEMHFGPALNVVSGNYVAAKRRGIINGVDFGYSGEVGAAVVEGQQQYRGVLLGQTCYLQLHGVAGKQLAYHCAHVKCW